jgi:hypothetical protein
VKAAEGLRRARELISDPTRWTKHTYAKDAYGEFVDSTSGAAVCFCTIGAVHAAFGVEDYEDPVPGPCNTALHFLRAAVGADELSAVALYNDSLNTAHIDVLRLYDKAIALAEEEE